MARTYNDIYYNDDENSTAEILDDMKKLAESVDQQIGSIKSFNNDTSQFIEQVTPLMNNLSEQVIDMHQLADTMFTELEQVKEENKQLREDLESDYEEKTVEGTDIEVNDSAEMRAGLKICGNHKQEVRSGKNLLKFVLDTQTVNGLTITNNGDGSLSLNGTTTDVVSLQISNSMANLVAGTYYLSRNSSGTVSNSFNNLLYGKNDNTAVSLCNFNTEGISITTTTDYATYYLWLYVKSGITFTNYVMKPQLESGTATEWEQYGASPSPDYPSEVECCGDNINIFDGEVEEGNIDASTGQNTAVTNAWRSKNYIDITEKTNTISIENVLYSGTAGRLLYYDKNNKFLGTVLITKMPFTFEAIANTAKVRFHILNAVADINSKVKLSKGTSTGEYSEYGQGCASVKIENENLYNINNKLVDAAIYSDGSIKAGQYNYLIYFKVKSGYKYVFSYTSENQINTNAIWGYSKEKPKMGGKATYNIISVKSLNNYIFEPKSDDNYLLLRLNYISQLNLMNNIQLKKSTDSKNYVSYQEQSFIMPTQKEMLEEDYFDTKNYKEVHNWKKIVLNGSETYTAGGSSNEVYRYDAQILINSAKVDKNKMVCTHFKSVYQDLNFYEHIRNSTKENPTAIVFYIKGKKTLTEFKAWLRQQYEAETPVTIYYKLTTPEQIEMTLEQKRVSDEIKKAKSYYETTIVTSEDEIQPNLEFTYKRSNKLRVENLEKALLSQGGGV